MKTKFSWPLLFLVLTWTEHCFGVDLCKDLCDCALEEADCSQRNLTTITDGLQFPEYVISTLDLSRNKIVSVKDLQLTEVPSTLEVYDFSVNFIRELEPRVFQPLNKTMRTLRLQNNVISILHKDSLAKLGNLATLVLSFNVISSLPDHLFDDLVNLEYLDLNYNPIQVLLETTFMNVKSLKVLNLSFLQLDVIHSAIFDWNLTINELDLSYNSFTSVPSKALWYLRKTLRKLQFSGNSLVTLDAGSFFGLEELKDLTMERMMSLKSINAFAFKGLKNLENFQLKYLPKIQFIDHKAFRLSENETVTSVCPIRDFVLEFSILGSLPEDLLLWDQMRYISIASNRLDCDCQLRWMLSSSLINMTGHTLYCSKPREFHGIKVQSMKEGDFRCRYVEVETKSGIVVIGMILVLAMIISFGTVLVLVYRRNGWICRPPRIFLYDKVESPLNTITIYDRGAVVSQSSTEIRERVSTQGS